jgi:hypothetical protein
MTGAAPADGAWGIWDIIEATRGTGLGEKVREAIDKTLGHLPVDTIFGCGWVIIKDGGVSCVGWVVENSASRSADPPEDPGGAS